VWRPFLTSIRKRIDVWEIVVAGGWLMLPILLCSVAAAAIIGERFWALQRKRIVPANLVAQIWQLQRAGQLDAAHIAALRESSPLGRVLAAGLVNLRHDREVMKESITETGRQVVLELERYLNTLGTIASITPLLGLLGTVIGMIKVFTAITAAGVGNPGVLAGGISEALITTATGLSVAIPSLMFYRYFRGRVEALVLKMEEEALKLVEVIHGEREREPAEGGA
jgi:biopolymer transport protein ExbB